MSMRCDGVQAQAIVYPAGGCGLAFGERSAGRRQELAVRDAGNTAEAGLCERGAAAAGRMIERCMRCAGRRSIGRGAEQRDLRAERADDLRAPAARCCLGAAAALTHSQHSSHHVMRRRHAGEL